MKTVRDACELHDKALSIRLSDQIEKLDALINAEDDGAVFFERTHITEGMRDLISEGITRLAGASSQAVFHLKEAVLNKLAIYMRLCCSPTDETQSRTRSDNR